MDLLQVKGDQIVDSQGRSVFLRGVCVGGWMNMEDFINGYPGPENGLCDAKALGAEKAESFFDRWLDYFFAEADVEFLKSLSCTVVQLPLNYRHIESDLAPFEYLAMFYKSAKISVMGFLWVCWCSGRQQLYPKSPILFAYFWRRY
jgi:hypothetical protein